jgi:hypothetical protein
VLSFVAAVVLLSLWLLLVKPEDINILEFFILSVGTPSSRISQTGKKLSELIIMLADSIPDCKHF